MKINNFDNLAKSPRHKQALLIAGAGLEAIDTRQSITQQVSYDAGLDRLTVQGQDFQLSGSGKLLLVGFGKVAFAAAVAFQDILGDRLHSGWVLDVQGENLTNLRCIVGSHPLPSQINFTATQEILQAVKDLGERDTVICVVSGGGSSLLCSPYKMTLEAQGQIIRELMRHGVSITEMNTVRKHISTVKGGQLAKAIWPARLINLIFSDISGDDLTMVASGPTLKDTTTVADARMILEHYNILTGCGLTACELIETPKEDKYFTRVSSFLLVSGDKALQAMAGRARELGLQARIYDRGFKGEASSLAAEFAFACGQHECLLAGGESVVTVTGPGSGFGGRNLEMALAASQFLSGDQVFLAINSDGRDNSDFAGAIVDGQTAKRAASLGVDVGIYLRDHVSFLFFEQVGGAVLTGKLASNVSDLVVCIK